MHNVVEKHIRPGRPERLSQSEVWAIIQKCWVPNPKSRPHVQQVLMVLKPLVSETATNGRWFRAIAARSDSRDLQSMNSTPSYLV